VVNTFFYYDEPFLRVLLFHNKAISFELVAVALLMLGLFLSRVFFQQKCTEDTMREGEEKYRSLVESIDDCIYLIDRNFRYLFMNK
jgi:PAS domain-containing protein